MTCSDFTDFLADYLAGELPKTVRAAFESHLTTCAECLAYLKSYRATIRLGKAAFAYVDEPVPDEVPEDLVRAILAARKKRLVKTPSTG